MADITSLTDIGRQRHVAKNSVFSLNAADTIPKAGNLLSFAPAGLALGFAERRFNLRLSGSKL